MLRWAVENVRICVLHTARSKSAFSVFLLTSLPLFYMTNNLLYSRSSWKNECFPARDAVKDLLAKKTKNKVCNLKYVIHQTSVFTDIHFGDVFHIHRKRKKKKKKKKKSKRKTRQKILKHTWMAWIMALDTISATLYSCRPNNSN